MTDESDVHDRETPVPGADLLLDVDYESRKKHYLADAAEQAADAIVAAHLAHGRTYAVGTAHQHLSHAWEAGALHDIDLRTAIEILRAELERQNVRIAHLESLLEATTAALNRALDLAGAPRAV